MEDYIIKQEIIRHLENMNRHGNKVNHENSSLK